MGLVHIYPVGITNKQNSPPLYPDLHSLHTHRKAQEATSSSFVASTAV